MPHATAEMQPPRTEVILPQEHFWQCYSRRLELPLSAAFSITLHVLVAVLIVVGPILWLVWRGGQMADMPPELTVAEITGGGGTDGDGFGPGVGRNQVALNANTKEQIQDSKEKKTPPIKPNQKLQKVKPKDVVVPDKKTQVDNSKSSIFVEIKKKAEKELAIAKTQVAKAMGVSPKAMASATNINVGGMRGTGGGAGGGDGKGIGKDKGPGRGTDPNGKLLTKSQKRERRWLINFSGSGEEHVRKLKALNVTLALPTANRSIFRLVDLSGPQPRLAFDNLVGFKSKVKWFNSHQPSLEQLALVLKLRYTPKFVVIFLPEQMEEEMTRLETSYKGRPEHLINFTWFEIKKRDDGSYGPVVVGQR